MSAPRLTRALMLEAPVRVADGAGGYAETWAVRGTLWAALETRGSGATRDAGLPVAAVAWRITVRGAPQGSPARPEPGQRLRDGARVFTIRAVAKADPSGRYLTCFADEEVAP